MALPLEMWNGTMSKKCYHLKYNPKISNEHAQGIHIFLKSVPLLLWNALCATCLVYEVFVSHEKP